MLCGGVYLKWILIIQEFDDLSRVISVELLSLCWSLVLKSSDVNLGSASLIWAHAQWTFRMGHSIIHSILISTAALIHMTGTSIYTLIHGIATLMYIARTHGCVRNDNETHEIVLLDCTTGEAASAIQ